LSTIALTAYYRSDDFTNYQVTHFRVLVSDLVGDSANTKFIEHASDKTEPFHPYSVVENGVMVI
jgi:hypothetical protein